MNGQIVDSCLVLAVEADGGDLVTVEGLAGDITDRLASCPPSRKPFSSTARCSAASAPPASSWPPTTFFAARRIRRWQRSRRGWRATTADATATTRSVDAVAAVAAAGPTRVLARRGPRASPRNPAAAGRSVIGERVARVGGTERVNGEQLYVADIHLPGELHAKLVTIPVAHARIIEIDLDTDARRPERLHPALRRGRCPGRDAALRAAVQRPTGDRDR